MKHYYYIVAAMLALSSCYSPIRDAEEVITEETETEPTAKTKAFVFHPKGDFLTNYEDMTRASIRLEENNTAGMTDLWVLDYSEDGTLIQQVHQSSTDDGFGSVPMNLTYGKHDIKFVASKGTSPSLTETGITWTKVNDTFSLDYPVEVTASSNGNRAPELKRCISGVTIENSDAIPANAKEMQVTIVERYSTLTLPALVGSNAQTYTNTFTYLTEDAGVTGLKLNTYTLCPSDAFSVDVRVKIIAKDNSVISEFEVADVELKPNRKTILKGECFDRTSGFSVSIDDAWDDASTILF